jgi:hypothetical protein
MISAPRLHVGLSKGTIDMLKREAALKKKSFYLFLTELVLIGYQSYQSNYSLVDTDSGNETIAI